jgi:hypothetical protein
MEYGSLTSLGDLRNHWGSAYLIHCYGLGNWVAQRRDDHSVLRAESPEELRTMIRADYTKRPVPR